jgi:hypothetical protein
MPAMESDAPEGSKGGQARNCPHEYEPTLSREARYLRWVIESALREAGALTTATPSRRCTILGTTLHGLRAGGRFLRSDDPGELDQFLANALVRSATAGLGLAGIGDHHLLRVLLLAGGDRAGRDDAREWCGGPRRRGRVRPRQRVCLGWLQLASPGRAGAGSPVRARSQRNDAG